MMIRHKGVLHLLVKQDNDAPTAKKIGNTCLDGTSLYLAPGRTLFSGFRPLCVSQEQSKVRFFPREYVLQTHRFSFRCASRSPFEARLRKFSILCFICCYNHLLHLNSLQLVYVFVHYFYAFFPLQYKKNFEM